MIRRQVQSPASGYALDDGPLSWWSVVAPEGTVNLCPNPSFEFSEVGPNDWSSGGTGTRTRSAEDAYFGRYSYKLTKTNSGGGTEWGTYVYLTGVAIGQVYTLSAYVKVTGKLKVELISAGIPTGVQKIITANGWTRVILTTRSTTTDWIQMRFSLVDGPGVAYIDGLQFEAKPYATTYCDGDQPDCSWNPYTDTSVMTSARPNESRRGGRLINFRSFKWVTTAMIGLGLSALTIADTQYALGGGGFYQRSIPNIRNFSIVGQIETDGDIDLARQRQQLGDLLKPNTALGMRPVRLVYQPVDGSGNPMGEIVNIDAVYTGGLEGNKDNATGERVALGFKTYLPYVVGYADRVFDQALSFSSTFGNSFGVVMRNASGQWQAMGAGLGNGVNDTVFKFHIGRDGTLYAVGTFTTSGGGTVNRFAKWNRATQTWTTVGTFNSGNGNGIRTIFEDYRGRIYIGGSFDNTSSGFPALARGIARYDPGLNAWTTFTFPFGGRVNAIGMNLRTSELIVAGFFPSIGGITANNIALYTWAVGVWRPLDNSSGGANGVNDEVFAVTSNARGDVIAGGKFSTAGGVTAKRLAVWLEPNEITRYWGPLTPGAGPTFAGSGSSAQTFVQSLAYAPDGSLFIGGQFDTWDGQAAYGIAKYTGRSIVPIYPLLRSNGLLINVFMLKWLQGRLHVGGNFLGPNGIDSYDRYLIWNGSTWLTPDIDLPGDAIAYDVAYNGATKEYYVAFGSAAGGVSTSYANGITNITVASPLPTPAKIKMTGPLTLYSIKNMTTGKEMFFNVGLRPGESATLQTGPEWYFKSDWRGDLSSFILPGSNIADWYLQGGGDNVISIYAKDFDGESEMKILFSNALDSLDGAMVIQ